MNSKLNWDYFIEGANSILKCTPKITHNQVFKPTSMFVEDFFKKSLYYVKEKLNRDDWDFEDSNRIYSLIKIMHVVNEIYPELLTLEDLLTPAKNAIHAIQTMINFLFTFEDRTDVEIMNRIQKEYEEDIALNDEYEAVRKDKLKLLMELGSLQLENEQLEETLASLESFNLKEEMIKEDHSLQKLKEEYNELLKEFEIKKQLVNDKYEEISKCDSKLKIELAVKNCQLEMNHKKKIIDELNTEYDLMKKQNKFNLDEYNNKLVIINQTVTEMELKSFAINSIISECVLSDTKIDENKNSIKLLQQSIKSFIEIDADLDNKLEKLEEQKENEYRENKTHIDSLISQEKALELKINNQLIKNTKLLGDEQNLIKEHEDITRQIESVKMEIKNIIDARDKVIYRVFQDYISAIDKINF